MRPLFRAHPGAAHTADDVLVQWALWTVTALLVAAAIAAANTLVIGAVLAAAGVAYSGMSYSHNVLSKEFRVSLDQGWDAALGGMRENGAGPITRATLSATDGRIDGGGAAVTIEREPDDMVRVKVRVGWLRTENNTRIAALILESVERRLRGQREDATPTA